MLGRPRFLLAVGLTGIGVVLTLSAGCGKSDAGAGAGGAGPAGSVPNGGGIVFDSGESYDDGGGTGEYCTHTDVQDHDGDGWSFADGDCNDCDVNTNPGAVDTPGNKKDEDCNGKPDDEPSGCDADFKIDDQDPFNAAKAIGLCRFTQADAKGKERTWGVISAKYVGVDGTELPPPGPDNAAWLGRGLLNKFGPANPQEGATMLALSTGVARAPDQANFDIVANNQGRVDLKTKSGTPEGFPKQSSHCADVGIGTSKEAFDPQALELKIRMPTNAKGFTFKLNFHTFEFPQFICTDFNDAYATLLEPRLEGLPDSNISFDQDNAHISVNNSFLRACQGPVTLKHNAFGVEGQPNDPKTTTYDCPLGLEPLVGTGFDYSDATYKGPHAATGWIETIAKGIAPGTEITIRFAIWDAKDHILDSTVLIDGFSWHSEEGKGAQTYPARAVR